MRRVFLVLLLIAAGWSGLRDWQHRAVHPPGGMIAPKEPSQHALDAPVAPMHVGDYTIQPVARYDITARLLGREPYYRGRTADLSPLDFALGWGPMSDSDVLDRLELSQSSRFLSFHWREAPIPPELLFATSSNNHLIPSSRSVRASLDRMRPGQVVHLRGYLVNVSAPDGWFWHSSTTRADNGDGACELMWVEDAFVERAG
jgi:hypothetical protein